MLHRQRIVIRFVTLLLCAIKCRMLFNTSLLEIRLLLFYRFFFFIFQEKSTVCHLTICLLFATFFVFLDRRQSKTLLAINDCGSNIAINSVSIFDLRSSIVLNFDLIICLIWFVSLRPSQQSFIYVGTGLPVLNQF